MFCRSVMRTRIFFKSSFSGSEFCFVGQIQNVHETIEETSAGSYEDIGIEASHKVNFEVHTRVPPKTNHLENFKGCQTSFYNACEISWGGDRVAF